jgi:hypothetical protein
MVDASDIQKVVCHVRKQPTLPAGGDGGEERFSRASGPDDGMPDLGTGVHFDHAARSYSVAQPGHAFDRGAMLAAEKCAFFFEPVADDMDTAISAGRS